MRRQKQKQIQELRKIETIKNLERRRRVRLDTLQQEERTTTLKTMVILTTMGKVKDLELIQPSWKSTNTNEFKRDGAAENFAKGVKTFNANQGKDGQLHKEFTAEIGFEEK
nr:hypothetical protein [Leptospira mayottensis]